MTSIATPPPAPPAAPAAPAPSTSIGQSVVAALQSQFAPVPAPAAQPVQSTNGAPSIPTQIPAAAPPPAQTQPPAAPAAEPATPLPPTGEPSPATTGPITSAPPAIEDFDFDAEPKPPTTEAAPAKPAEPVPAKEATPAPGATEEAFNKALETGDPDKVLGAVLQTSRGKRMYEAFKTQQELSKPFAEGGIGRVPTIEDIKAGETARLQMTEMIHEFEVNPGSWIANFFGRRDPQSGMLNLRPGVETILTQIPDHVLKVDPSGNLFNRLAAATFIPYLESQAQRIGTMPQMTKPEADLKLRYADALWMAQTWLGMPLAQIQGVVMPGQPEPTPGQPDPLASERQRLATERQQLEAQRQQQQSQIVEQRSNYVITTIDEQVHADVDRLLTNQGIRAAYPEVIYNNLVKELARQAEIQVYGDPQQGVQPMNPSGFANYRIQFDQAVAGRLDPKVPATAYRQMAQAAIRFIAPKFLEQVTARAVEANGQRHQQMAQGAAQTAPPSNGAAAATPPQAVPPQLGQRPQGMDMEDHIRTQLQQAMTLRAAVR